jgi:SAM-dependent methyltransferase
MIELHRKLLGDDRRNQAFFQALAMVIKPGKTVVADIGSGTGFLSFLASRLGAKRCYAYEVGEVSRLARKVARRNAVRRCTFIDTHSTDVEHPPLVDVLVTETLGNYALEENILETIEDGRRFLKSDGLIIPGRIRQMLCPVIASRVQEEIDAFPRIGFDLNFDAVREIALNNIYVKTLRKSDLLSGSGAIRTWDTIDFSKKQKSLRKGQEIFVADRSMTVYGLGLWWEADLVEDVMLSTSPFAPLTHWEQIYLPLLRPLHLKKGDRWEIRLNSDTRWQTKINLRWTVSRLDRQGRITSSQTMDMRRGFIR